VWWALGRFRVGGGWPVAEPLGRNSRLHEVHRLAGCTRTLPQARQGGPRRQGVCRHPGVKHTVKKTTMRKVITGRRSEGGRTGKISAVVKCACCFREYGVCEGARHSQLIHCGEDNKVGNVLNNRGCLICRGQRTPHLLSNEHGKKTKTRRVSGRPERLPPRAWEGM